MPESFAIIEVAVAVKSIQRDAQPVDLQVQPTPRCFGGLSRLARQADKACIPRWLISISRQLEDREQQLLVRLKC